MVKYTQTLRRQIADELFECDWPFCGIGALRVNIIKVLYNKSKSQEKTSIYVPF